jgi:hypothetical protein
MQYFICYIVLMIPIAMIPIAWSCQKFIDLIGKRAERSLSEGEKFMVGCLYVAVVYGGLIIIGVLFLQNYLED